MKFFAKLWLCLVITGFTAGAALAFEPPGLKPGDKIPAFEARNQYGQMQSFTALAGEKGVALFFVRSADWCPFCKIQLIDLQNRSAEIEALGYNVVTVSYDPVEKLKKFSDKYKVGYTALSDPESKIIKAFGILNEEIEKDSDWYGIPHPAVYLVGKDGVIQARFAEEGYKDRPPVDAVLEGIADLKM